MTLSLEAKESLSSASQKKKKRKEQCEQNTGRRLELQSILGEHGEAKFGWGTDCMREREDFSGAWKLHRAGGGEGKGKEAGLSGGGPPGQVPG